MAFVAFASGERTARRSFFFLRLIRWLGNIPSLSLSLSPAGLSTSCIVHSLPPFPLSFSLFFRCLRKCARILLSDVAGIKNDVCHGSGRSKISPIVRRRADRPGFPGVRLEHISAPASFPCEMLRENTLFASAI